MASQDTGRSSPAHGRKLEGGPTRNEQELRSDARMHTIRWRCRPFSCKMTTVVLVAGWVGHKQDPEQIDHKPYTMIVLLIARQPNKKKRKEKKKRGLAFSTWVDFPVWSGHVDYYWMNSLRPPNEEFTTREATEPNRIGETGRLLT